MKISEMFFFTEFTDGDLVLSLISQDLEMTVQFEQTRQFNKLPK